MSSKRLNLRLHSISKLLLIFTTTAIFKIYRIKQLTITFKLSLRLTSTTSTTFSTTLTTSSFTLTTLSSSPTKAKTTITFTIKKRRNITFITTTTL